MSLHAAGSASTPAPPLVSAPPAQLGNGASEPEAQWSLKDVYWRGSAVKVITQNRNGPCSLLALCNILLLRGDIVILPPDRPVVTYSYLSELLADYLLSRPQTDPEVDLGAALSVLPRTQSGLDVDVHFASHDAFSTSPVAANGAPSGTGELALFKLCGVPLVHGWLADPSDSQTYHAVMEAGSYNRATDLVVQGDEIARGAVVQDRGVGRLAKQLGSVSFGKSPVANAAQGAEGSAEPASWTEQQASQVHRALLVQQFLDATSTQLTYHGLFVLAQAVQPGQLVALFRNSHVSVLYRRLPQEGTGSGFEEAPALFTLVTDAAFLLEDEIVWESLVDVDGASSQFFDGKLQRATLRDGDFVGGQSDGLGLVDDPQRRQQSEDADFALAFQLHQREQERVEEAQRRGEYRGSRSGRQGRRQRPELGQPGSSYDGQPSRDASQPGLHNAVAEAPIVPTEVFTTMRYQIRSTLASGPSDPGAEAPLIQLGDSSVQRPVSKEEADALVRLMLPVEVVRRLESTDAGGRAASTAATTPAAAGNLLGTNPFLSRDEAQSSTAAASTNPFLAEMASHGATGTNHGNDGDGTALDPVVSSHRLARHVPLLAEHLQRLEKSAGAMCRIYSQAWSANLLKQRRALQPDEILKSIEDALASSSSSSGSGSGSDGAAGSGVKGIRVAVTKDGRIVVRVRDLTPFPSGGIDAADGAESWAGRAPPPAVRIDDAPTRVRAYDLEPVAFNKTDARGFYERAKARVAADPAVLSGVRPDDGRCFDVLLWTDEPLDAPWRSSADHVDPEPPHQHQHQDRQQLTESSLANIVVEFLPRAGEGGSPVSRFVTPPSGLGMLDGLMRSYLVTRGVVREEPVGVAQLRAAVASGEARLWLCNSLRGMWVVELVEPVVEGGVGVGLGDGRAGGETGRRRWSALVKRGGVGGEEGQRGGKGKGKGGGKKGDKCVVM